MGISSRLFKKGDKAQSKEEVKLSEKTTPENGSAIQTSADSGVTTPQTSHHSFIYPDGDFRKSAINQVLDIKCDVMVNWLHQQQLENMWTGSGPSEGVVLKKSRDNFTCCPPELEDTRTDFFDAVRALNVKVRFSGGAKRKKKTNVR